MYERDVGVQRVQRVQEVQKVAVRGVLVVHGVRVVHAIGGASDDRVMANLTNLREFVNP